MTRIEPGLLEIVREFLAAHRQVRRVAECYRRNELPFEELRELVGDDERSTLFRLKERSHALFRPGPESSRVAMRREALFDLAVGSLFHEAMKFRESFYQREVYGPRVRALRSEEGEEDTDGLFQEFEKILAAVEDRLDEGLQETLALVDQTRDQLRVLLAKHSENGLVARYLIEQRELAEDVFGKELDALLSEIYGDASAAYALAGRSYLHSGYYDAAGDLLDEATARGGDRMRLGCYAAYARGMSAYLRGEYATSVAQLERWSQCEDAREPNPLGDLAHAAVSRIGQLALGDDRDRVAEEAAALLKKLPAPRKES